MAYNKNWAQNYLKANNIEIEPRPLPTNPKSKSKLLKSSVINKVDVERIEIQMDFNIYVDNGCIDLSFLAAHEINSLKQFLIKI